MNDRVLEADDDTLVSPDDWASLEPKAAPLSASEELQRQVDEFLANGGHIKEFEPGESAIPTHQPLWSFPVGKAAAPDPVLRKKHDDLRLSQVKKRIAGDAKLVEMMDAAMNHCTSMADLRAACGGCSPAKIWRMIRDHFATDPRAERFRHRSREEREADLLVEVRKLLDDGVRGIKCIAERVGRQFDTISALDKKHKLGIALPMGSGRRTGVGRARSGHV